MSKNGRPRVLLVKHWIDIHDRGLRLIASRCKDAGFEVVYASYSQPEEVVKMAAQEDVDVVGMSFFTRTTRGTASSWCWAVLSLMRTTKC